MMPVTEGYSICVMEQKLPDKDKFRYLGSTMSSAVPIQQWSIANVDRE
jgi:hypothetical protein